MPRITENWSKILIAAVFVSVCAAAVARVISSGAEWLDSNLASLIPESSSDAGEKEIAELLSSRFVVLIEQSERSAFAYDDLKGKISDSQFAKIADHSWLGELGQFYFLHRNALPGPSWLMKNEYSPRDAEKFVKSVLFAPFVPPSEQEIKADPYLAVRKMASAFPSVFSEDADGKILVQRGSNYYLFEGDCGSGDAARSGLLKLLRAEKIRLERDGIRMIFSGAPFFAADNADKASGDVALISACASILSLAMLLFVFRSALPIISSAAMMGLAMIFGAASEVAVFGKMHVIALAFGACLVGICFDYALHACLFARRREHADEAMKKSFSKALFVSFLTSSWAYLAMAFADIGILKQLAVFAVASLAFSCAYAKFVLMGMNVKKGEIPHPCAGVLNRLCRIPENAGKYIAVLLVFAAACVAPLACIDDQPSSMQSQDEGLADMDKEIKTALFGGEANQVLYVLNGDSGDLLERCDDLLSSLSSSERGSIFAPCLFVSSAKRQAEYMRMKRLRFADLQKAYAAEGIDVSEEQSGIEENHAFGADDLPEGMPLHMTERAMLVRVSGNNPRLLEKLEQYGLVRLAEAQKWESAFSEIRNAMTWLFIGSYVAVAVLLACAVGRGASVCFLVSVGGGIAAGILADYFIIDYFNLFSVLASIMILGLGADYCVFMASARSKDRLHAAFSLLVSFLTTELCFGILACSRIAVAASFGIVLAFGLAAAFALAIITGCGAGVEDR